MANIFVMTGSGISSESGIQTYRAAEGLWAQEKVEDVATLKGFRADPMRVLRFYDARLAEISAAEPNAAHLALAALEADGRHAVTLVTQNVDDLHERAGSRNVIHLHGEARKAVCSGCGDWQENTGLVASPRCGRCGHWMRPDIVWFGEDIKHLPEVEAAFLAADTYLSIGTSGEVWPAAGYARRARNRKYRCVEFNTRQTAVSHFFRESRKGPATSTVPAFVDVLLRNAPNFPM